MKRRERGIYERTVKRVLDVLFACLLSVILSPLFLLIAVAVRVSLGSPVIFRQARGGRDGRVFYIYKFRTMTDDRDTGGELLPDEKRLTVLGRVLRTSSLDELPQLFNILRGEMSFVGPRPQSAEFLSDYTETEMKRHSVLPGLTGLAQVNGRNALSWKERFLLDLRYAERISFGEDLKIVLLTFGAVFGKRRGGNFDAESFYDRERL